MGILWIFIVLNGGREMFRIKVQQISIQKCVNFIKILLRNF